MHSLRRFVVGRGARGGLGVWMLMVVLAALGAPADAARVQDEEDDPFRRLWARAASFEVPQGYVYRWHVLKYPEISDAKLAEYREKIEGKPDHPLRRVVERETRRREEPDRIDYQVWYWDEELFRRSSTHKGTELHTDIAVRKQRAWAMTDTSLTVTDPSNSPSKRDYTRTLEKLTRFLETMAFASMPSGADSDFEVLESGRDAGGGWFGVASAPGVSTLRWTGRCESGNRCLVESKVLESSEISSAASGRREEFRRWAVAEPPGLWIAHEMRQYSPDGELVEKIVFDGAEPISRDRISTLTEAPPVDGEDPIRGATTFTSIQDYTEGEAIALGRSGQTQRRARLPESSESAGLGWRGLGWILAGVLAVLFFVVRFLRSRSGHGAAE